MSTKLYSDKEILHIFMEGILICLNHFHKGNGLSKFHIFLNIISSEEVQMLIDKFIIKQFNAEINNMTSNPADKSLTNLVIIEQIQQGDTTKPNNQIDIYELD